MNHKNIEIALDRISNAKMSKSRYLDLSGLKLDKIPEDISDMNYLLDIDLSYNRLLEFPTSLAQLDNLQYLNLSCNSLREINLDTCRYYSFKEIDISENLINFFPSDLLFLNGDVKIYFYNNPFLDGIPEEIIQQEDLNYIDFYFESLRGRDSRIRLFEVKLLLVGKGDVGKTTLMKIIEDPQLEVIVGEEESTHGINILSLDQQIFFPAKNPFYNKYEDFDDLFIKNIEVFDEVELDEPYFETELEEIHNENGINEQFFESELIDFEIKEDGVAKQTNYVPIWEIISDYDEESMFHLKMSEEPMDYFDNLFVQKNTKVNIWDFGGQEILYSTHQFFLTKRSVYIFVWEPRTDNEEDEFDYWLNIIHRLSDDSPVLVVMNKADVRIKSIDEHRYRVKFKNIIGFFKVSCLTKEGVKEFIDNLNATVSNLPHLGDILPNSWDDIRNKITSQNQDFIPYGEFKDICNNIDLKNIEYISGYLVDIGEIIHFKDDLILKNIVILNPHWLTKAIYELIHSLEIQRNFGLFDANKLSEYLNIEKYPPEKHYEILSLMEKFEICFKIIGSNNLYLIPTLLQATPSNPSVLKEFIIPEALKFEIKYNYMPSGLIERLICRLNDYIYKESYWKYGVVFNTENNKGLVRIHKPEKKIVVYVVGEVQAHLYNVILNEINLIHKDLKIKDKDYLEFLACTCNECSVSVSPYMFDKRTLKRYLEKSRSTIECHKSGEPIEIDKLLIGYKSKYIEASLLRSFVNALSQLQSQHKMIEDRDEDYINQFLQNILRSFLKPHNYLLNEQARRGKSETEQENWIFLLIVLRVIQFLFLKDLLLMR
jgi:GTPase SAR1 family protein